MRIALVNLPEASRAASISAAVHLICPWSLAPAGHSWRQTGIKSSLWTRISALSRPTRLWRRWRRSDLT